MRKLVTFSGSFHSLSPSKTKALVETITHKAIARYDLDVDQYSLSDLGSDLGLAQNFDDLGEKGDTINESFQQADAIIIATPVYKGSYPGLFKHFIDLLDPDILYGKPILLAATGGGKRHALMVEHQLRPLLGFFMAHSLPTAIYASAEDYSASNQIVTKEILQRIDQAVDEFSPFIHPVSRSKYPSKPLHDEASLSNQLSIENNGTQYQ